MRFGVVHHSLGHDVPVEEAMRAVHDCGALVFATGAQPENREQLAELSSRYGLELVTGWWDRFIEHGTEQPTAGFEAFCREVCEPLHIHVVGTCSTHHRWRTDPPLDQQLEQLAAAFGRLCPVAADHGVTLAIENHADYRAGDLLALLDRVNSPQLRVQLDTGNPYAVAEEPVEAARLLAPYAVSTHIKDMTIRPLTDGEWVKVLGCPLGDGNVDLRAIATILAAEAPPDLPFTIEVEPPPGSDVRAAFERSVAFVRRELSDLVRFGPGSVGGKGG